MSNTTSIEWTSGRDGTPGKSWNPIGAFRKDNGKRGWHCVKKSAGCAHCYAEAINLRLGTGLPFQKRSEAEVDIRLVDLDAPLRWRKAHRVFVNSMTDLFLPAHSFEMIAAVWGVMAASPQHTFIVLTKHPERAREFFAWVASHGGLAKLIRSETPEVRGSLRVLFDPFGRVAKYRGKRIRAIDDPWAMVFNAAACGIGARPLSNVELGTSVENQETADSRIPELLACPAAVRIVSYEPALGPVDFRRLPLEEGFFSGLTADHWVEDGQGLRSSVDGPVNRIDQVIIGGESGPRARPFDIAWARDTIRQCREAGVACFVKQLGAKPFETVECFEQLGTDGALARIDTLHRDPVPPGWTRVHTPDGKSRLYRYHQLRDRKGGEMSEWPEDLRIRMFPGDSWEASA